MENTKLNSLTPEDSPEPVTDSCLAKESGKLINEYFNSEPILIKHTIDDNIGEFHEQMRPIVMNNYIVQATKFIKNINVFIKTDPCEHEIRSQLVHEITCKHWNNLDLLLDSKLPDIVQWALYIGSYMGNVHAVKRALAKQYLDRQNFDDPDEVMEWRSTSRANDEVRGDELLDFRRYIGNAMFIAAVMSKYEILDILVPLSPEYASCIYAKAKKAKRYYLCQYMENFELPADSEVSCDYITYFIARDAVQGYLPKKSNVGSILAKIINFALQASVIYFLRK